MIILKQSDSDSRIAVHWNNNACLGYCYREIDGYYVFVAHSSGCWTSHSFRAIADALDSLNDAWDRSISEYFKNNKTDLKYKVDEQDICGWYSNTQPS